MKFTLFLSLALAFGLVPHANAQMPDYSKMLAAQKLIKSRCDLQEATYSDDLFGTVASYTVRLMRTKWTGGCVEGLLDGEGTLAFESRAQSGIPAHDNVTVDQQSGLMVKGKQVGPWRIDVGFHDVVVGAYYWLDIAAPGMYIKLPNGSFQQVQLKSSMVAGMVEPKRYLEPLTAMVPITALQVEEHIRSARLQAVGSTAGDNSSAATTLVVESTLLQDLLRGNKARLAGSRALGNIKGKRLLIVLSSNSLASFDALDAFKNTVIQYSPSQPLSGPVLNAAMDIASAADKKKLIDALTSQLRSRFASVNFADDLSNFKKTDTDLVVVFDFTFKHEWPAMVENRLAQLALPESNYRQSQLNSSPGISVGGSAFILNSDLAVVRSSQRAPKLLTLRPAYEVSPLNASHAVVQEERLQAGFKELALELRKAIGGEEFVDIGGTKVKNANSVLWPLMGTLELPFEQ
jgi:hypothetical protein